MKKNEYQEPKLNDFDKRFVQAACSGGNSNVEGDCNDNGSLAENVCMIGIGATGGLCHGGSENFPL